MNTKTVHVKVRMTSDEKAKYTAIAKERRMCFSEWIREAMKRMSKRRT